MLFVVKMQWIKLLKEQFTQKQYVYPFSPQQHTKVENVGKYFHSTTSQWLSSYTKDNHCGPNETCTKSQVF